ncbi:MAG: ATP-binding protein [Bullifex sp.]
MLFLLILGILISSVIILVIKKNARSVLLTALSFTLFFFHVTILIYIAKKGGISNEMSSLLFISKSFRNRLQYTVLTLNQLGYLIALGRYIFPPLLLWCAFSFSYFPLAVKIRKNPYVLFIIPGLYLIAYYPYIFRRMISSHSSLLAFFVRSSQVWIVLYIVMTVIVMLYEYREITAAFFKRRFVSKCFLLFSLGVLYSIFAVQDPAQVYLFYQNDYMWMMGLWFLSRNINVMLYTFVGIICIVSASIGFFSFLRYAQIQWDEEHEEAVLRRKGMVAYQGAGIFIHGIKNELIASRVLMKRLSAKYADDEDLKTLSSLNDRLINRLTGLYSSFRSEKYRLVPINAEQVISLALEKFYHKYPGAPVNIKNLSYGMSVLGDAEGLSEAVYNILINAYEANMDNGKADVPVILTLRRERLWISVTVSDSGKGIGEKEGKLIYEPFYSTKNSASSWGMGMYYARSIIKNHMGSIRFESSKDGTSFIIMLPRYGRDISLRWEV